MTVSFCHPIKERLPIMPRTCAVFENHIAFWLSKTHFVVEAEIKIDDFGRHLHHSHAVECC
jgi:hypothetical protein